MGDDAFDVPPDLERGELLRRTGKAVIVAGRWRGHDVVAKRLSSTDRHWVRRFAHEVAAYRVFAVWPPPWRVPRLHYAGRTVLVIERLPGEPPHADRYPPRLGASTVTGMFTALAGLAAWRPPAGPLRVAATDWPGRIRRYVADGDLPGEDQRMLLATVAAAPAVFGHGDPLASNALLTDDGAVTFIDFEFAGLYPAGADLALLGILLGRHDAGVEQRCASVAEAAGCLDSYRAMRVPWLARELRLYESLFDTADDREHREWLEEQAASAMTTFRRMMRHG
ncbi:phosphotransferase [Paractinoplanes rhizophilus]|uniref:Phosphotransferase n=1 Tax=Paractinoplanes rhizophilus TaxID=1416877 RepID=A0ABW2I5S9_9ACTN